MTKYYAGIDSGTTGVKVVIFDENGAIQSKGYSEYDTKHPASGWVDQDMNALWEGVVEAAKQATRRFPADVKDIVSIGISSQRGSFVPVDEHWRPLRDAIVWSDARATKQTEWIYSEIGEEKYYQISGQQPSSLWVYPKLMWLKENEPHNYDRAWKFLNGQEWILHNLGATKLVTIASAMNYNGMFDINTLDWSEDLLERAGLDKDKLPPILHQSKPVGHITEEVARLTGFAVGTLLAPGGGDQQCAAVGSGVNKVGIAELSMGTAAVMVAQLDEAPDMITNKDSGVMFGSHAIAGKWDMEGTAHAAGSALRWWRDSFGQNEVAFAQLMDVDAYDLITLQAANVPIGSNGLIFFPFFNSQATPYYHDTARGGMLGIHQIHDRAHTARAVLEGIVYELRMSVEAMEATLGRPFDTIRLSGGGAKSDFWNQMQADIYGRPVEKLKVSECAALGAAILGAVGVGQIENVDKAIDRMVKTHTIIQPNMANHAIYNDYYQLFKKAFLSLRDGNVYNELAAIVEKHRNDD